jgi:hypothetical protein
LPFLMANGRVAFFHHARANNTVCIINLNGSSKKCNEHYSN